MSARFLMKKVPNVQKAHAQWQKRLKLAAASTLESPKQPKTKDKHREREREDTPHREIREGDKWGACAPGVARARFYKSARGAALGARCVWKGPRARPGDRGIGLLTGSARRRGQCARQFVPSRTRRINIPAAHSFACALLLVLLPL